MPRLLAKALAGACVVAVGGSIIYVLANFGDPAMERLVLTAPDWLSPKLLGGCIGLILMTGGAVAYDRIWRRLERSSARDSGEVGPE